MRATLTDAMGTAELRDVKKIVDLFLKSGYYIGCIK
jgi:hypothetical protein